MMMMLLLLISAPCEPVTWTKHADKHVSGGRRDRVATLDACKTKCVNNSDCTGIDWDDGRYANCWLHGSWSKGGLKPTTRGTDHYSLTRNDCAVSKTHLSA